MVRGLLYTALWLALGMVLDAVLEVAFDIMVFCCPSNICANSFCCCLAVAVARYLLSTSLGTLRFATDLTSLSCQLSRLGVQLLRASFCHYLTD